MMRTLVAGYQIIQRYDCIERHFFESMQRKQATAVINKQPVAATPAVETNPPLSLRKARRGFPTVFAQATFPAPPLPCPPAELFVPLHFRAANNPATPAFVTPDRGDGRKHPAIVWLAGADGSALIECWVK